jgi:hypothetical protein
MSRVAGGKARGPNRQYQIECRDVLISRNPALTRRAGDGIDVPFELPAGSYALLALASTTFIL